jgi:hypothetical protein
MPTITIELTEEQKQKIDAHFAKGRMIKIQEETMHGASYTLSTAFGLWLSDVNSQARDLSIGDVELVFAD